MKFAQALALVLAVAVAGAVATPWWQDPSDPRFQVSNAAQLKSITADPLGISWLQEQVYEVNIPGTNDYVEAARVTFVQRQYWNDAEKRFDYEHYDAVAPSVVYYTLWASTPLKHKFGDNAPYEVEVIQPNFAVSAALFLDIDSHALSANEVITNFIEPNSGNTFFHEIFSSTVPGQFREYNGLFKVYDVPSSGGQRVRIRSTAVPNAQLPPLFRDAVAAKDAGTLVWENDRTAPAGIELPVQAYIAPADARRSVSMAEEAEAMLDQIRMLPMYDLSKQLQALAQQTESQ